MTGAALFDKGVIVIIPDEIQLGRSKQLRFSISSYRRGIFQIQAKYLGEIVYLSQIDHHDLFELLYGREIDSSYRLARDRLDYVQRISAIRLTQGITFDVNRFLEFLYRTFPGQGLNIEAEHKKNGVGMDQARKGSATDREQNLATALKVEASKQGRLSSHDQYHGQGASSNRASMHMSQSDHQKTGSQVSKQRKPSNRYEVSDPSSTIAALNGPMSHNLVSLNLSNLNLNLTCTSGNEFPNNDPRTPRRDILTPPSANMGRQRQPEAAKKDSLLIFHYPDDSQRSYSSALPQPPSHLEREMSTLHPSSFVDRGMQTTLSAVKVEETRGSVSDSTARKGPSAPTLTQNMSELEDLEYQLQMVIHSCS